MRLLPLCLLLALATAAGAQPFETGVNQAWLGNAYGHDLTGSFDRDGWARIFDRAAAHEARVVRVWIFEDMEGVQLDAAERPVGVEPRLPANLATLSALARDRGVRIYWTLHDGNLVKRRTAEWLRRLLTDEAGWGQAFRRHALGPVLDVLHAHADVVWALDLLNETQGALRGATLDGHALPGVWPDGWDGARRYLATTARFVHDRAPGLRVSASAGHHTAARDLLAGRYDGLGLDLYDLHLYGGGRIPCADRLVAHARAQGVPIVLGEFGPKQGLVAGALRWLGDATYARYQTRVTRRFLTHARDAGFAAAFPWRLEDGDRGFTLYDGGTPRPALAELARHAPQQGLVGALPR